MTVAVLLREAAEWVAVIGLAVAVGLGVGLMGWLNDRLDRQRHRTRR